jgi:3-oxoacyl-[acyl-carrier-protein] synthase II
MNRVAITGIGAITPIGNDASTFWDHLVHGVCGIAPITHFDTKDSKVTLAAEVKGFDPLIYMDKRDARKADLYTQYAVAAASEAMEDSKLLGTVPDNRLGVYVGSGIGGMETFMKECIKCKEKGPRHVSPFFIPMLISNMAAGTIAIRFSAKGPSMCITTACATSANTIGEAYRAIQNGYADAMIAGGSEATINELATAGFANCMALHTGTDPNCASIPFDKRRSGFVMGEGGAILILENYDHAKKRSAHIYAEICGYGNTNDAYHMTAPEASAESPAEAIRLAVAEAKIAKDTPLYINAHGTSTALNDKTETLAFKKALGESWARSAWISSTKSMHGHMLGATGAAEAIACVKALETGIIPPTIHYEEPDPECDLFYTPNEALKKDPEWAISTNLGFGGHNACLAFHKEKEA